MCLAVAAALARLELANRMTVQPPSPTGHEAIFPALAAGEATDGLTEEELLGGVGVAAAGTAGRLVLAAVRVAVLAGRLTLCSAASRFASADSLIRTTTSAARTSTTTPPTIAAGTRQSGGRWISVRALPHSRHHSWSASSGAPHRSQLTAASAAGRSAV